MKFSIKIFTFVILMTSFNFISFSQKKATCSATVSATIVTPITMANTTPMNFGNIAVKSTSGTLVLAPSGTRIKTGGVTLSNSNVNTDKVTAAIFTISGENAYSYAITLPSSNYTITNTPGESMVINGFTSYPFGTGVLTGGIQTIKVGATLNFGTDQTAGIYTNTTGFDITINYN